MQSFRQFVEARGPSGKVSAILDLVNAIKTVFKKYNIDTRKLAWNKLTSTKGQKQLDRLLRSPLAPVSDSEFVKLVENSHWFDDIVLEIEKQFGIRPNSISIVYSGDGQTLYIRNRLTGKYLQITPNYEQIEQAIKSLFGLL